MKLSERKRQAENMSKSAKDYPGSLSGENHGVMEALKVHKSQSFPVVNPPPPLSLISGFFPGLPTQIQAQCWHIWTVMFNVFLLQRSTVVIIMHHTFCLLAEKDSVPFFCAHLTLLFCIMLLQSSVYRFRSWKAAAL